MTWKLFVSYFTCDNFSMTFFDKFIWKWLPHYYFNINLQWVSVFSIRAYTNICDSFVKTLLNLHWVVSGTFISRYYSFCSKFRVLNFTQHPVFLSVPRLLRVSVSLATDTHPAICPPRQHIPIWSTKYKYIKSTFISSILYHCH